MYRRACRSYHIQTVNHRHRQWKAFLGPFRGGATNVRGQLLALVSASRIGVRGVPAYLLGGLNGTDSHTFL